MNPLIQLRQTTSVFLIAFGLTCFGLSPTARALTPPPDGGYPGQNTAEGDSALFSLNTGAGVDNTAVGHEALQSLTTGVDNTAIGESALHDNRTGFNNVAIGSVALSSNRKFANTAIGVGALMSNTTGHDNTALGVLAGSNTTGSNNIDIGSGINGIAGESNACRIGSIFGQTAANGSAVFITSGHKLGTATSSKRFKENINPMNRASEVYLLA